MNQFYINEISENIQTLDKKKNQDSFLTTLRLYLFVFLILSIVFYLIYPLSFFFYFFSCWAVCFVVTIYLHKKNGKIIANLLRKNAVCEQEIRAINGDTTTFPDGAEFNIKGHLFANDLDVFGNGSLFHTINRTVSKSGYKRLGKILSIPSLDATQISETQKAINELSLDKVHLLKYLSLAYDSFFNQLTKEKFNIDHSPLISLDDDFQIKRFRVLIIKIIPIINLLLLFGNIFSIVFSPIFLITLYLEIIFLKKWKRKIKSQCYQLQHLSKTTNRFKSMFELIVSCRFIEPKLLRINDFANDMLPSLHQLDRLLNAFDDNLNVMVEFIFNLLLLRDIRRAFEFEQWKRLNLTQFIQIEETLAEYECLMSLANYTANFSDNLIFPIVCSTNNGLFKAENLGHPLLDSRIRIPNSFSIDKDSQVFLITGANMSGKSTFLRTIGVNMLLASIGSPVCATFFEFIPCRIFTSMRITDALKSNESYFYAEVLRLKQLKELMDDKEPILIIIDELFSGTNSEDREIASERFVFSLLKKSNYSAFIATHDLPITQLEQQYPKQVLNYCFEIDHVGDDIKYDYVIKAGITKNHNALYLLNKLGVLD